MDGHQFDDMLRALSKSRRSLLGAALAAAGGLAGFTTIDAKKKKKKCAKKCKDGCCTGKHGKCIKPAQQSSTRCGTGGEICRSTGCIGDTCASTCAGCCAGNECIDPNSDSQCGRGGVACEACTGDEVCQGTCCVPLQKSCTSGGTACCFGECKNGTCCSQNQGVCQQDSDCCDAENSICESGQCVIKTGMSCQPGWMCQGDTLCPGSGICGEPEDCTVPCAEQGRCSQQICIGVLNCCTQATFDECSGSEDFCGCITEGGECTRILL